MNNFFRLYECDNNRLAEWDNDFNYYDPRGNMCDKCERIYDRDPLIHPEYLKVVLPSPKIDDVVWTWYGECLLTEKVANILEDNKVTGYELRPVIIKKVKRVRKKDYKVPILKELVVTGKGGEPHKSSRIKVEFICEECGRKKYTPIIKGLIIDENKWDGTDTFTIEGFSKYIMISNKVKNIFESHKITGCVFIPSENIKPHISLGKIFGVKAKDAEEIILNMEETDFLVRLIFEEFEKMAPWHEVKFDSEYWRKKWSKIVAGKEKVELSTIYGFSDSILYGVFKIHEGIHFTSPKTPDKVSGTIKISWKMVGKIDAPPPYHVNCYIVGKKKQLIHTGPLDRHPIEYDTTQINDGVKRLDISLWSGEHRISSDIIFIQVKNNK
ncbi:MAG: hypothetical protein AB1742_09375 [bacterium]